MIAWIAAGCALIGEDRLARRLDPDGDGVSYPADCDDGDPAIGEPTTWYRDGDGDGHGRDGPSEAACEQPDGHTSSAGDCLDDDAAVYPGATDACGDGKDQDCDGDDVVCNLDGDEPTDGADAVWLGAEAGDQAAWSVALAGDVSGDGSFAIAIGATDRTGDSGEQDGAIWIVDGDISGVQSLGTTGVRLAGSGSGGHAGFAVAAVGDATADGLPDVLAGAPNRNEIAADEGVAWLATGPFLSDTDLDSASFALGAGQPGALAGWSVSGSGDVDGDGVADVAVGAPAVSSAGAAWLFLGPIDSDRPATAAGAALLGEADGDQAGRAVAIDDDGDGDGIADVLVGAYGWPGGEGTGCAYVVRGPVGGTVSLGASDAALRGEEAGGGAAASVAWAGDTDGDGLSDVLVGDPDAERSAGIVYLLRSPVQGVYSLAEADARLVGEATDGDAGWTVAGAGDTDGDGRSDVLVGAPYTAEGRGYLFRGPVSGGRSLGEADVVFRAAASGDHLGIGAAGGADVDGDGYDDVLLGAPGADAGGDGSGSAYLFFGG